MQHARHLFLTTDWAVKRIAIECGVSNGSNFVRYFKRRFGVLPSEFRNHVTPACTKDDESGDNTLSSES
jgi:AraC-like DNA-binding protein